MTFAEYNTDENFNKPSNAMELVRLGKAEGKTREDIVNSLSPLWKEDKKGNVKKALDYHFNTEVAPKEKAKIVEPVTNNTTTVKNTNVDENFANRQNAISTNQEDYENERQTEKEKERWNATNERMQKLGESIRKVDDHSIENLPTFIWQRYKNGEFGDLTTPEGKKDAKVRLAYFMLNNLGTALGER